jgi:hypothetical protein
MKSSTQIASVRQLGGVLLAEAAPTVLQANASKKRSRRLKSLLKLEQEELEARTSHAAEGLAHRVLEEAESLDAEEDVRYLQEGYPDEIFAADEAPTDRLDRIRKAIAEVELSERHRQGQLMVRQAKLFKLAWSKRGKTRRLKRTPKKPRRVKVKGLSKAITRLTSIKIPRQRQGNTADPDSKRMPQAQTGDWVQGHRGRAEWCRATWARDKRERKVFSDHHTMGFSRELITGSRPPFACSTRFSTSSPFWHSK